MSGTTNESAGKTPADHHTRCGHSPAIYKPEFRLACGIVEVSHEMCRLGPSLRGTTELILSRMLGALPDERGAELAGQLYAAGLAYCESLRDRDLDRAERTRLYRAVHNLAEDAAHEQIAALIELGRNTPAVSQ